MLNTNDNYVVFSDNILYFRFQNSFYQLATNALSDIDDCTDKLVECNDVMLERIAALLDNCENEKKSLPESEPTTSNITQLVASICLLGISITYRS